MTADPRWLEILKASGGQSLAFAVASGGLLALHLYGVIPALDPWMIQAASFIAILGFMLWIASIGTAFYKFYPIDGWARYYIRQWRQSRDTKKYIPHMTAKEKEIIAYLLVKNEKTFTGAADGGYAVTLISRGIVARHLVPGQHFLMDDTPFTVPDNVWRLLVKHKDEFPLGSVEVDGPYPWRDGGW